MVEGLHCQTVSRWDGVCLESGGKALWLLVKFPFRRLVLFAIRMFVCNRWRHGLYMKSALLRQSAHAQEWESCITLDGDYAETG